MKKMEGDEVLHEEGNKVELVWMRTSVEVNEYEVVGMWLWICDALLHKGGEVSEGPLRDH